MANGLKAFISYSHLDDHALTRLSKHLSMLKRDGSISEWFDQKIIAGGDLDAEISSHLDECDLFLALVSADFLASNYCYEREMKYAFERHDAGTLRVVPVIVQPCDWQSSPLGKLKALPRDGKAVSEWTNENTAWLDVVTQLRRIVNEQSATRDELPARSSPRNTKPPKYRLKRDFDDVDRQEYREQAFATMRDYFKKASAEIREVENIRSKFAPLGDAGFTCTIVNRAKDRGSAHITVYAKSGQSSFGDITYSFQERAERNTANGWFQIEADEYDLYLKWNDMTLGDDKLKLQPHQAVEQLWEEFLGQAGITYG